MFDTLLTNGAAWFTAPAVIATLVFALRLAMMLMGIGGDGHAGLTDGHPGMGDAHSGDAPDHSGGHHGDSAGIFQYLTVQSMLAFMMGMGWAGLAAYRVFELSWLSSSFIGAAAGVGTVWALTQLLRAVWRLQSSGNVTLAMAQGAEGRVDLTVPSTGTGRGRVRVVVEGRERTYDAVAGDQELPTGARIRVVRCNDDNSVTVMPA